MKKSIRFAVAAVVFASFVFGVSSMFAPTEAAGPCLCPDIYAPVKCSNGKTYPNLCVANCNKAKNCVRTGDI